MDTQWHRMMQEVLSYGERRNDRTGKGTRALFGMQERFDLRAGFPACTTKKLHVAPVFGEVAAFLVGAERLEDFHRMGCGFWDGNASAPAWKERQRFPGDVGRIYGAQWRRWRSAMVDGNSVGMRETDQLRLLVKGLQADPHGRRHVVTCWQPGELDMMCLPPCHLMFQCFASDQGGEWLDLQFTMRSLDLFLGMPADVAHYALLAHLIGREVGRRPRFLLISVGDAHVYLNHAEQVEEVRRRPLRPLPELELSPGARLFGFLPEDASLRDYDPHPALPAPLNV